MTLPQTLRSQARAQRRALSPEDALRHGSSLARQAGLLHLLESARTIAAYLPNDGETDTGPLIALLWKRGKRVFLPLLRFAPHKHLAFGLYRPDTALLPNQYGIPEPVGTPVLDHPGQLDLALVPLVAFDGQGHRIGMGGGFYDRTFAYLKAPGAVRAPLLIGLAHECQKYASLPAEPWDVPLDGVATERAFYPFNDPASTP